MTRAATGFIINPFGLLVSSTQKWDINPPPPSPTTPDKRLTSLGLLLAYNLDLLIKPTSRFCNAVLIVGRFWFLDMWPEGFCEVWGYWVFCFHDDEMYFLDTIFPPPLSKNCLLAQILGLRPRVGGGGCLIGLDTHSKEKRIKEGLTTEAELRLYKSSLPLKLGNNGVVPLSVVIADSLRDQRTWGGDYRPEGSLSLGGSVLDWCSGGGGARGAIITRPPPTGPPPPPHSLLRYLQTEGGVWVIALDRFSNIW